MRAASVFRRCKSGHGAGARRRRLRSGNSARAGLLRRSGHARWQRAGSPESGGSSSASQSM
jgi:hypothetical protein